MSLNDSNRAETVKKVLANIRAFEPVEVSFREEQLKGGTVGNVFLIQGTAKMSDGQESDFKLVHKIQKKWERYADPDSWCREYDLYAEKFDSILSDSFCMPRHSNFTIMQGFVKWGRVRQNMAESLGITTV